MAAGIFHRLRRWWYRTPTTHVRMVVVALVAVALLVGVVVWLTA